MRGEELLNRMELVDPEYVTAADVVQRRKGRGWIRWSAFAACLCVAIIGAVYLSQLYSAPPAPTPKPDDTMTYGPQLPQDIENDVYLDEPREVGTIVFNEADTDVAALRQYVPGYFTEQLSEEKLALLQPNRAAPDMAFSGYAGFDGEGKPLEAVIKITAPFLNGAAVMRIAKDWPLGYYELSGEAVASTCNGVDITAYLWCLDEAQVSLCAYWEINGYSIAIGYDTGADELSQAKIDFEVLLDCVTSYDEGKPDLAVVEPEAIPEFFDREQVLEEARSDPEFGAWMPEGLPDGFAEESIRRYKDQSSNELSGLWTKGYDELSWRIYFANEEALSRVTKAADTQNYDLSLYPIPRAQSVPEELREIVNNPIFLSDELTLDMVMTRAYMAGDAGDSNGWRMNFSVKYGEIVVEIRTKGVEPEWIYQQLTILRDRQ